MQGELGANAILAASMAACRTGAAEKQVCENLMFIFQFSKIQMYLLLKYCFQLPLYKHIADLAGKTYLILPAVPAFTLVSGGKHTESNLPIKVST